MWKLALAFACSLLGLTTVVPPRERFTKKILVVVDRSASMNGDPLAEALGMVSAIAGQPVDELDLAVIAFADQSVRWTYKGKTWAKLPDADALKAAKAWLLRVNVGSGTEACAALELALKDADPKLTVIFISDGIIGTATTVEKAVAAAQKKRKTQALIATVGIGQAGVSYLSSSSAMANLGREHGGGFFVIEPKKQKRTPLK